MLEDLEGGTTMMEQRHAVQVSCDFYVETDLDDEGFHSHGEEVLQELMKLEACNTDFTDSTIGTDSAEKIVTIDVFIFGEGIPEAIQRAFDLIRTAVHATGAATPNWPVADDVDHARIAIEYPPPARTQAEPALV